MSTVEICKVHGYAHCWKCGQDRIFDLERENARLKQFIRNPAGYRGTTMPTECPTCGQDGMAETERDRAEALAELRGEALNNMWGLHHGFEHKGHLNRETCPATSCQDARAAIAAKPEGEGESPSHD